MAELAGETILVSANQDSAGFTDRHSFGVQRSRHHPRTGTAPYPDLGLQAVREHLGIVIYARSAFPDQLDGSAFVRLDPPLLLPFHLAVRTGPKSAPVHTVLGIAQDAM